MLREAIFSSRPHWEVAMPDSRRACDSKASRALGLTHSLRGHLLCVSCRGTRQPDLNRGCLCPHCPTMFCSFPCGVDDGRGLLLRGPLGKVAT